MSVNKKRLVKLSQGCAAIIFSRDGKGFSVEYHCSMEDRKQKDGTHKFSNGEYLASAVSYALSKTDLANKIVQEFSDHLRGQEEEKPE